MVEKEGVRNIVLCVALEVKDDSELVVDLTSVSKLPELVAGLLPKLWEPDCGHQDPRTHLCAPLNQLNWVVFSVTGELLVWVVELLPQRVLHEVELTNWSLHV